MQWTRETFRERLGAHAVIGMVHLKALPGSPMAVPLGETIEAAVADAKALVAGGVDAILVENFGDRPFFPTHVPVETVSMMTRILTEIRLTTKIPMGVNVLRNDGHAALAVASAVGAVFVRVNVLVGAMLTDQGLIEGDAAALLRRREVIANGVAIFADHLVKHASPIAALDPRQLAKDLRFRALADAVIVSGRETGAPADPAVVDELRTTIDAPLLIGSGIDAENAGRFREADGVIVGTSIKKNGDVDQPVDVARVENLVRLFKRG